MENALQQLSLDEIDGWLLSGAPVVRLAGRDYGTSTDQYADHLEQLTGQLKLGLAIEKILEPPGVVLQTFLPDSPPPVLTVPVIKVSKTDTPWLFCVAIKCRNRVDVPGSECEAHQ
jgi:hypothetical protein